MSSNPTAPHPGPTDPMALRLLSESLKTVGSGRIHLRGDSMLPTLREGWKLHVRSVPAGDLRVGEIGIFIHRDILTIHRLIWKKVEGGRERFVFQGDNNPVREIVEADAILGRVEAAEGEWARDGLSGAIPLGRDERAFFYRNAYRLHTLLSTLIPAARLPGKAGEGAVPYRLLRGCFRLLEPLFAPRPRR